MPNADSWMSCRTPGHHGAVPGGDQNGFSTTAMYNNFGKATFAEQGVPAVLKDFFGVPSYPETPFNVARFSLFNGRAMVLGGRSADGTAPTPAKPWMAYQNFVTPSQDSDLYQEMWLQLAASGIGQFFYFAPLSFGATMREHILVSKMLSEMTMAMGCADSERHWITDTNIRWQDDFLLSGSTVGSGNRTQRVWRFTPSDPASVRLLPHPIHAGSNITIPVQLYLYGKLRPCHLLFQDATMRLGESSHHGWWLMQPDSEPAVGVNCSESTESSLVTVWPLPNGALL